MAIELSARLVFGACAFALAFAILQLIRHGQLKEKYALLWLPLGAVFTFFGLFPEALVFLSGLVRLHYITVVLLFVILAFTLILLYLTARLSQLREDVKRLAQEMALLKGAAPRQDGPLPPASDGWSASPLARKAVGEGASGND